MDDRMLSYLYYFNIEPDYYLCHEYGESLWMELGRPLIWKGLIQAAVCLYHLHNGNVRGGWRMWQRARRYIAPWRPVYEGMDLDALTEEIDRVYSLVPAEWYDRIIPPAEVQRLNLPTPKIRLVNPELAQKLASWKPVPLDELGHPE